jgi:uncharacterized membrane protein
MHMLDLLATLTWADALALGLMLVLWLAVGLAIEKASRARPSVSQLVAELRREWMRQYLRRENHIFDAQMLASLRQGTSFFASTCLIAVGGVLALIGNTTPLATVAEGIGTGPQDPLLLQVKLLPTALFLTYGFLKFVWAHRIFGYCSVAMAAIPEDRTGEDAARLAAQAAELNIRAAINFNRGLRSMYFALGALGWLAGPIALSLTIIAVTWVVWSREFWSHARDILRGQLP